MHLKKVIPSLFPDLIAHISPNLLDKFRDCTIDELTIYNKSSLGIRIRAKISLRRFHNKTIRSLFIQQGINDIDSMSFLILLSFHQYINDTGLNYFAKNKKA